MYPINMPTVSDIREVKIRERGALVHPDLVELIETLDSVKGIAVLRTDCTLHDNCLQIQYAAVPGTLECRPIAEHCVKYNIPKKQCAITRPDKKIFMYRGDNHLYSIHVLYIGWKTLDERNKLIDAIITSLHIAEAMRADKLIVK